MKTILLASTVFFAATGAAFAADAVAREPAPDIIPAGFVWTGGYLGLQAGYAWSRSHNFTAAGVFSDPDPAGIFGGVYAGYNHQFPNNVVLGIEADMNVSGMDGRTDIFFPGGGQDLDHQFDSEVKWNGALRARLGYAIDRFMPYVAGGLSVARYEFGLYRDDSEYPRQEAVWTGWNIGAGVEYAATDKLLVRAEYRYTDYGDKVSDLPWGDHDPSRTSLASHDIRLGVAYKF